jgi:hypothetical protein
MNWINEYLIYFRIKFNFNNNINYILKLNKFKKLLLNKINKILVMNLWIILDNKKNKNTLIYFLKMLKKSVSYN